ncbi:MAG: hypothetical protein Q7N50_00430 [Armatimonadota bacterium]|nr:hypothetical protein [Armatimonadota bacterium]
MATVMEKLRLEEPMKNFNYDIIHLLSVKLQNVSRYEIYKQDATEAGCDECIRIFDQMKADDEKHVQQLRDQIEKHVKAGQFI